MCGRYYIDDETSKEIEKILQNLDKKLSGKVCKTGEIFPTDTVPILIAQDNQIVPEAYTWGLPNFYNKGIIINARSETAFEKKMFRESLVSRRCIIPANGFYEWTKRKEKYYFTQPSSDILYMAGIYTVFQDTNRFAVLTTGANASMTDIHDRMPLVLNSNQLESWLYDSFATQDILNQVPVILQKELAL